MAIADTITSMYENVGEVYDTLTNVDPPTNKNIENIPSTIRKSYLNIMNNGYQDIWDSWDKVNGSGTTITLNNTVEAPMRMEYKGQTSQSGTPTPSSPQDIHNVNGSNTINVVGKNLFGTTVRQGNVANITIGDRLYFDNVIYVQQGETYTISTNLDTSTFKYAININTAKTPRPGSANWDTGWITTKPYTFTAAISGYVGVPVAKSNGTDSITPSSINNVWWQLEKGNQATTYTPYTSNSYEIDLGNIELNKISTYQDYIRKSTGKNLLNRATCEENKALTWNTGATFNETGSISTDYIKVNIGDEIKCTYSCQKMFYDKDKNYLGALQADGTVEKNSNGNTNNYFTVPNVSGIYYVKLGYRQTNNSGVNLLTANIMVNEGTTALPYEPYGTGWYLKKEIGKVVLDNSTVLNYNGTAGMFYASNQTICSNYKLSTEMLCNYLSYSSTTWVKNCFGITATNTFWLYIENGATTLADLQTWLGTNKPVIYYQLNTPTYETITDTTLLSQLEEAKKSYESKTNISQENDDLPFELDVVALSDGTTQASLLSAPLLGSMSTQEEPETLEEVLEEPEEETA